MKKITILVVACGLIGLAFAFSNKNAHPPLQSVKGESAPVAVLELFTSEGCISCPSADRLLPELARYDSNVITLSFHVDYWDRLGWKDPFSSRLASDRQKEYGKQFRLTSIYTPQLVVNGAYELVGNVRSKAELTIKKALAEKALTQIAVSDVSRTANTITIKTRATGETANTELQVALLQKDAVMKVNAGENSGATLTHTNIVRAFEKQTTAAENTFQLQLPDSLKDGEWSLVLYTRQKNTLRITGATRYAPSY